MNAVHKVEFTPGEDIYGAVLRLTQAADEHGEAVGKFNHIELHAKHGDSASGIVIFYQEECERRHMAWVSSPKGKEAERKRQQSRQESQSNHDALMQRLPALDMNNDHDVLDWLCAMQEPTDHAGVIVKRETIIEKFRVAGYEANENTGPDYRDGNRSNMFRYLVGQALDGLNGPAIHPILHKFADEWRARFPRVDVEERSPT